MKKKLGIKYQGLAVTHCRAIATEVGGGLIRVGFGVAYIFLKPLSVLDSKLFVTAAKAPFSKLFG